MAFVSVSRCAAQGARPVPEGRAEGRRRRSWRCSETGRATILRPVRSNICRQRVRNRKHARGIFLTRPDRSDRGKSIASDRPITAC
ncbi:hypothetical protein SAM23877_3915 [Streptomyces ambofaciens ATCC 23877]|uniref:Uncharacterized protein n=1 Tax=Streptomyces ambofaciens (strain ATCC 23877 / 3486 / DSM 40053 / JCM 4204 / NBRC 12836 / NRRL B-2516) TaxID=278992 RepID=A0A0K2AV03_STRA7|nr:hypothetical protein SAM23877_3915 [Streptomyces ambofaciens ATCC 23877]